MTRDANAPSHKYYISLYANFRDEAPYLYEWIVYHLLVGVEHFYLYNHKSKDNYMEILQPFIDKGLVTLHNINSTMEREGRTLAHHGPSTVALEHCIYYHGSETRWIWRADCDEFLCLSKEYSLRGFLSELEDYGAVGLNWVYYGTSNQKKKQFGYVIERFLYREKKCEYIKSANPNVLFPTSGENMIKLIFQPDKTECMGVRPARPHSMPLVDGAHTVNEKGEIIPTGRSCTDTLSVERAWINHYFFKSVEEFVDRRLGKPSQELWAHHPLYNTPRFPTRKDIDEFLENRGKDFNVIRDDTMLDFAQRIRNFNLNNFCNKKRRKK